MTRDLLERVTQRTMQWNFRLWGFGEAIAARGLLEAGKALDDPAPFAYVQALMRAWLGRGVARSAEDHVGAGRELIVMWEVTNDAAFLSAARSLAALHSSFPAGDAGARCHRPDQPGWRHQIWVDCMDVDAPFLVRLGRATGEDRHFDQGAEEILAYARLLQDERTGLMFHGHERSCGRNGVRWARGNGWALMGLTDTLALLPREHRCWRELDQRLTSLCDALISLQDPSGLWHTVIDDPDTYLESTLAAMAAYAFEEGERAGLIDGPEYRAVALRAREALYLLIDPTGALQLVSDATPVGQHAVYATRPFGVYPWGQGPLLVALAQELERS